MNVFDAYKGWSWRRTLRAQTRDLLERWTGLTLTKSGQSCCLCDETTQEIKREYKRRSLTGESFTFHERLGFACLRCQTVSLTSDCSVSPIHVAEWAPG